MKCTKCGKEIPDGESKVCNDCQKRILKDIENAEGEVIKGKTKVKISRNALIFILIIIMVLLLVTLSYATKDMVVINPFSKNTGNTIGNIRNYGYIAEDGNDIYYIVPNKDSSAIGIFKITQKSPVANQIYMAEDNTEVAGLNVYGDYLYFILMNENVISEEDEVNNKICRVRKDGTDFEVLNDNEFNNECYEIYVVKNKIYYIDLEANIAYMNLDGSNKNVLTENHTGFLGINEDYIIYNVVEDETDEENTNYITYMMNLDGSNPHPILENTRIYSINIEDDYIYYTDYNKKFYRTKIGSNESELIRDIETYNLNIYDGYAYYFALKEDKADGSDEIIGEHAAIYKMNLKDLDNREDILVKDLETYSYFLDVVKNNVVYLDSNETAGFIRLVKLDDTNAEPLNLYMIDFTEMYETTDTSIIEEDESTDITNIEEVHDEEIPETIN